MPSHYCNVVSHKPVKGLLSGRARRGAVSLEFAILAVPFFLWLLFIFELGYDLFLQEALDGALHIAVRQIQTGQAANLPSGAVFINQYLCPAAKGLLECGNNRLSISVKALTPTAAQPDYASITSGSLPMNGSVLAPFTGDFCNASPKQLILVQALYIGPSFVGGLLPGVLSVPYQHGVVHPTLSTAGFVVEPYTATNPGKNAAAAC